MNQVGTVIEILKDNRAKVTMRKHSACGDCGACQHGKENMKMNIIAANEISAKVGDLVEVDMETQNVLGAAFIVYVIPLIMMVLGIVIGNSILRNIGISDKIEIYSAIAGFILMAVSFAVIKTYEQSFQRNKKYIPTIAKIVK